MGQLSVPAARPKMVAIFFVVRIARNLIFTIVTVRREGCRLGRYLREQTNSMEKEQQCMEDVVSHKQSGWSGESGVLVANWTTETNGTKL